MAYRREPTWGTAAFPLIRQQLQCRRCATSILRPGSVGTATCRCSAPLSPHTTTLLALPLEQPATAGRENNCNTVWFNYSFQTGADNKRGRPYLAASRFVLRLQAWVSSAGRTHRPQPDY